MDEDVTDPRRPVHCAAAFAAASAAAVAAAVAAAAWSATVRIGGVAVVSAGGHGGARHAVGVYLTRAWEGSLSGQN